MSEAPERPRLFVKCRLHGIALSVYDASTHSWTCPREDCPAYVDATYLGAMS